MSAWFSLTLAEFADELVPSPRVIAAEARLAGISVRSVERVEMPYGALELGHCSCGVRCWAREDSGGLRVAWASGHRGVGHKIEWRDQGRAA